jgi:hypothetical protein
VIEAPGNIHYGLQVPAGYERLAVFATHKAAMSVGFNAWPEPIEEGPQISPAQFWHGMAKATTEGDADYSVVLLARRVSAAGKEAIEAKIADAIARGFTPAIVVLVGGKGDKACGLITMVALPRTIETQMAGLVQ